MALAEKCGTSTFKLGINLKNLICKKCIYKENFKAKYGETNPSKLKQVKDFKPKKYKPNNSTYIKNINNYIKEDNHISWYNKLRYFWNILFFILVGLIIYLIIK